MRLFSPIIAFSVAALCMVSSEAKHLRSAEKAAKEQASATIDSATADPPIGAPNDNPEGLPDCQPGHEGHSHCYNAAAATGADPPTDDADPPTDDADAPTDPATDEATDEATDAPTDESTDPATDPNDNNDNPEGLPDCEPGHEGHSHCYNAPDRV